MDTALHTGQWIVSIIGVIAFSFPLYAAFQENKVLGIMGAVLAPVAVPVFVIMFWKKYPMLQAVVVFVVMGAAAAGFQRLRFGFWDWPDVDYQPEVAVAD